MAIILSEAFAAAGYSGCAASPFGSTVSGLGFVGCDLDIYLDLGLKEQQQRPQAAAAKGQLSQLQQPPVPVQLTEKQKVKRAAKLLRYVSHVLSCCYLLSIYIISIVAIFRYFS